MNRTPFIKVRASMFGVWGFLVGLIGSLCCIGPSAAILLGLGSSSALFGVQFDYTLTFIAGAMLLVCGALLALWRTQACSLRSVARWRPLMIMVTTSAACYGVLGLWVPSLAASQEDAVGAAHAAPALVSAPVHALPPTLHRLTLNVEKMICPPCAAAIRNRLKREPAVHHLVAEANNEQVQIDYDSQQVQSADLLKLIPPEYGVTLVRDEQLP